MVCNCFLHVPTPKHTLPSSSLSPRPPQPAYQSAKSCSKPWLHQDPSLLKNLPESLSRTSQARAPNPELTHKLVLFFPAFSPNPIRNLAAVGLSLSHIAHTTPTTSCVTPSQQSGCSSLPHHLLPKARSNSHLLGGDHLHPPVQTSGQSYPHVFVILTLAVLCLCFQLAMQHWIHRIRHKKPCLYCVLLYGSLTTVCVPGCWNQVSFILYSNA